MLTVDTLNQIIAHALAATQRNLGTDTPSIMLPEHYSVQSLEHLQADRARFRGALSTESLDDFCKYVADRSTKENTTSAFIHAPTMSCKAFFNLGTEQAPGHGDHTASLILKPTAAYTALNAIAGEKLSQQALAEWIEDWNTHLVVLGKQGEEIAVAAAVQKIRTITIKATAERTNSENDFSANRSSMDSIEAAHAEQQPKDLLFTFAPYEGLQERTFCLRLSIITGDKPMLKPRWVQQEQQQEDIAQEFKKTLISEIGGLASITIGTFTPGK
jgi:uncharacterized protein YfdQ (DUF2303 family)